MRCFCKTEFISKKIKNDIFYECPHCGYLKKESSLTPVLEKERYDMHNCDSGYVKYMEGVYQNILPYLKNGISLDFGCGQIHALADIMIKNNRDCDYYDLYYFPKLENKKYSNIILIEVFEHISDPIDLIANLLDKLTIDGRIIIMTQIKPVDYSNWWYLRDITHVSFFTYEAFLELASIFNLRLIYDDKKSLFILERIY